MKKLAVVICVIFAASLLLGSCSSGGGETALEYKGHKISEAMYGYWAARFKKNIVYYYNNNKDTADFWSSTLEDGQTAEEYFTKVVNDQVYKYAVGQQLFAEYGLKLSDDVKKSIDDDIDEKIDYYGSRAELNAELANINLNIDMLRDIYVCEEKLNAVYDYLYGADGAEALTDDDYIQYFKDNYWHMKYIVIYTTKLVTGEDGNNKYDESGNLLTEDMTAEELAAQDAKAAEALEKAQAGEDFDSLIEAYSEYDTSTYPNGFYLSTNEISTYGSQIISELAMLEAGGVARVDEESAIYIIKKLELPEWSSLDSDDLTQLTDMEDYAKSEAFDAKMTGLTGEVVVNNEILAKYKLSEIEMSSNSSI